MVNRNAFAIKQIVADRAKSISLTDEQDHKYFSIKFEDKDAKTITLPKELIPQDMLNKDFEVSVSLCGKITDIADKTVTLKVHNYSYRADKAQREVKVISQPA